MGRMTISRLVGDAWELAESKGFHRGHEPEGRNDTLLRLCLVHTEISEAAQEVKRHWTGELTDDQRHTFGLEMADAIIRIADLCGCTGVDLEACVIEKMEINAGRPMGYGTPGQGGM